MSPRTRLAPLGAAALVALLAGCGGSGHATAPLTPRTYRMGFALSAPRQDFPLILQALDQMTRRSDAAIMSTEAPWDSLLAGTSPDSIVLRQVMPLAQYYRGKNLRVWVYLDPRTG
jgi:hypothetical protein